jgi:predicted nucleic acid-binding Zn ribbon protein
MPIYLYEHIESGEIVEVLQGMNDLHEYHGEDGSEKGAYRRVYTSPAMSMDTSVDPFDKESFKKSTLNKNDTFGDLFARSKEASNRRAEKCGGVDPVKEKFYKDYAKKRNGKEHQDVKKKKAQEALKNNKLFNVSL